MFMKKRLAAILLAVFVGMSFTNIAASSESSKASVSGSADSKVTFNEIVLNHNGLTLAVGQSIQLKATLQENGKAVSGKTDFIWRSDKHDYVRVDGQGLIRAVKPGTKAVISVSSPDGKLSANCEVKVLSEEESANCVAVIGDMPVTPQEYTAFTKLNMNLLSSQSGETSNGKINWSSDEYGMPLKEYVKKQVLDTLQEMKIQLHKATDAGIFLNDEDLKGVEQQVEGFISGSGDREAAKKAIKDAYGLYLSEYKEICMDSALAQKYIEDEYSKTKVSDEEVKNYYDAHMADYDTATVTHILIATLDANSNPLGEKEKLAAKKKAEELLAKVKAGQDIKKLAEQYSQDPGVKENKGQYTFRKGEMVEAFENWAFTHAPGNTGIVETQYGYHVMKMDKREKGSLEALKDTIKASLLSSKFEESYTKKMNSWKQEPQFEVIINKSVMDKLDKILYADK